MKVKNLVIRAVAIAVVLSSVAVFAACSNGAEDNKTTSTSETTVSTEIKTEASTEEITEPTTVPVEEIPLVKNEPSTNQYVYDYLTDNGPYSGNFYCAGESGYNVNDAVHRLPQLNIDSEDAKEINEFLLEKYSDFFARERYVNERLDYAAFQNGNILSLAVERHYANNGSYDIYVFNIDVSTGEKLDTSEVIALSDATKEDVYSVITEDVETFYADTIASIPQLQEQQDLLAETKAQSLDKANLEQATCYFDGDGKLEDTFGFRFASCVQFETLSDVCGYLTSRI